MKFIDWIAIIGALAWLPHLIDLLKRWIVKSHIRVITHRAAEIGFTTNGPIFNLRLAFAVSKKDIVVSDLKIRVRHESGEEKIFEWQGITQQMGKMTMPDSNVMPFEKEQSVLAIKLTQKEIEERFIRCQDASFIASQQEYISAAVKKSTYLKNEGKYNLETFLREQEMTDLYTFNKHAFSWKPGKYEMTIEIQSPELFSIVDNKRSFTLSPLDIEKMSHNKNMLEPDYKRIVMGVDKDNPQIEWQWCNPILNNI